MNPVSLDQGWQSQFLTKFQKLNGFGLLAPGKPVSLRIGQSPGNSDEKKIPPEAVIWVTLMSVPPPPEGAVLCGSLWPGKGGIFESIMRSPVRQTHCVEAP